MELANLREDYNAPPFNKSNTNKNPFEQFKIWFQDILQIELPLPNAMTLATTTTSGKPSARIVLLKGITGKGFIFYTNYNSKKGKEIAQNPYAALLFYWPPLHRQIRIEGKISKASPTLSQSYFQSRPKDSQVTAMASPQSDIIKDDAPLQIEIEKIQQEFKDQDQLPLPKNWGGYLLTPTLFEFWQGQPNRLHDRIQYSLLENEWKIDRLAP